MAIFHLVPVAESFAIIDGAGVNVAYVYFDEAPERRALTKRLSKADAEEAAITMAAAIRAKIGAPLRDTKKRREGCDGCLGGWRYQLGPPRRYGRPFLSRLSAVSLVAWKGLVQRVT
jgi:hypothetical protein